MRKVILMLHLLLVNTHNSLPWPFHFHQSIPEVLNIINWHDYGKHAQPMLHCSVREYGLVFE